MLVSSVVRYSFCRSRSTSSTRATRGKVPSRAAEAFCFVVPIRCGVYLGAILKNLARGMCTLTLEIVGWERDIQVAVENGTKYW